MQKMTDRIRSNYTLYSPPRALTNFARADADTAAIVPRHSAWRRDGPAGRPRGGSGRLGDKSGSFGRSALPDRPQAGDPAVARRAMSDAIHPLPNAQRTTATASYASMPSLPPCSDSPPSR